MKQLILLLFYVIRSLAVQAQDPTYPPPPPAPKNIVAAEYFLDVDPGFGAGTPITLIPDTEISNIPVTVNTGGLNRGRHFLFIRTKDQSGVWSQTLISEFSTEPLVVIPDTVQFSDAFVGDAIGVEVMVRNYSSSAYSITGLDVASPFSTDATFPITVNAGESQAIYLEFAPTTTGTFIDSVKIYTTAGEIGTVVFGEAMSVVPVTLINLSASALGTEVRLVWSTTNEADLSHFDVERSADGQSFVSVATVAALNRSGNNHYGYTDRALSDGVYFYRVRPVDRDGKFTYSAVRKILINSAQVFQVFPNPVADQATITGVQPGGKLQLITIDGKVMRIWNVYDEKTVLDMSGVRRGLYVLRYDHNGIHHEMKIMKQ